MCGNETMPRSEPFLGLTVGSILGGSEEELQQLAERPEKTAVGCGMEVSSDKSKILVSGMKPRPSTNIWMNGKPLKEADGFIY